MTTELVILLIGLLPMNSYQINNDELIWPGRNWNLPSSLPVTIDQELISPACWNNFQFFLNELQNMELWALKMYDATGKVGSGVLRGNSAQLGDYEGCVEISEPQNGIQGQYCLASLFLDKRNSSKLNQNVLDLIQSYRAMHSTPDDIDIKIAPSFSELLWGLCVPSTCSVNEVENIFSHYLMKYNSTDTGLNIRMRMKSNSCQVQKKPFRLTTSGAITLLIYATVISTTAFATFSDYTYVKKDVPRSLQNPETFWKKIVMSFSLYSTIPDLLSTKLGDDEITCIHGIRFLFSILIYFLHKGVFGLFVPFTNRTVIAEILQGSWTMLFRAFWNVVDTFVVISGLLTSYYNFKKLANGKKLNIYSMYIKRYVKFTPVFLMTILTLRNFGNNITTGPLAIHVVDHFIDKCNNIWKSIFYISNIDGVNDMCYPPSHQLITDMQMYLLSPFIITALWKWKTSGLYGVMLSMAILTIYKGAFIYFGNYETVIYYGVPIKMIAEGGNQLYLNPLHRLTPYLSGVLLGYILHIRNVKYYRISSETLNIGWGVAVICAYYSFFGLAEASKKGFQHNVIHSAIFGMAQPLLWSFALCWVIFACHTRQAEFLNNLLSWKGFIVFSRIAYPFYMLQILIIFILMVSTQVPVYATLFSTIDLNEIVLVLGASVIYSLLFVLPLKSIILAVEGEKSIKNCEEKIKIIENIEMEETEEYKVSSTKELKRQKSAVNVLTLLETLAPDNETMLL